MSIISKAGLPWKREEEICKFLFDRNSCVTEQQEAIVSIFGNLCIDDRLFEGLLMELFDRVSHHREHKFPNAETLLRFCIDCLAGVGAYEYLTVIHDAMVTYTDKYFTISGFKSKVDEPDEGIIEEILGTRTGIVRPEMYHTVVKFLQDYVNSKLGATVRCILSDEELHEHVNRLLYDMEDLEESKMITVADAMFYLLCCGKESYRKLGSHDVLCRAEKNSHRAPKDDLKKIFSEIPKLQRKTTQEWIQYIYSTVPEDIKCRCSDMCTAIVYGYLDALKEAVEDEVSQ